MQYTVRRPNRMDVPAMREYLEREIKKSDKAWFKRLDARRCLEIAVAHGFILGETYIVLFSIEKPWFMTGRVITEQFTGRLYKDGDQGVSFSVVTDFLTKEAQARGCVAILAGSLFARSSRAIAKMYEQDGFVNEGVQLIKVL